MDRNTITGLILIGAILIGYSWWTQPSAEEIEALRKEQDSLRLIEQAKAEAEKTTVNYDTSLVVTEPVIEETDSMKLARQTSEYGSFATASEGEVGYSTLENEKMIVTFSNKGGRMVSVELKEFDTYSTFKGESDKPLLLFHEDSSRFNVSFLEGDKYINTEELYFEADQAEVMVSGEESGVISYKLYAGSKDKYVEHRYALKGNDYLLNYSVSYVGLADVAAANDNEVRMSWSIASMSHEKGIDNENRFTTIFWQYQDDDADYISETSPERIDLEEPIEWISFKQQFFSVGLIAEQPISPKNAYIETRDLTPTGEYVKRMITDIPVTLDRTSNPSASFTFYMGPNQYKVLNQYGIGLQDQIDLGWGIFGWMNEYVIIPIFNFLEGFNLGYGLIIFLLTIIIKLILSPIVWKNYISSAKMRVLKPEMDELNAKLKDADPLKKQQEVMALYKQAGVNPLAGCIPALLQMPILYALFRFFPSSIELRQKGFLWADDLSTYDAVVTWTTDIPLLTSIYGNHISLFTVLMAASLFFYTRYNMQMSMSSGPQAGQMKIIMYLMPIMLLFFFNKYSSGLSYYYFTANVVSMLQQLVIKKWFIDENAIHAKIQENKQRPKSSKKSRFQQQMEEMAKKRGYKLPK